jgi:hypothetical protein
METSIKNYDKIAANHLEKNKKPCDCEDRWYIEHPPLKQEAVTFGRNFGRNAGGSKRRKSKRRKSKRKNSKRRKSKRRK